MGIRIQRGTPGAALNLEAYGRVVSLLGPAEVLARAADLLPPVYRETASESDPERAWEVRACDDRWEVLAGGDTLRIRDSQTAAIETALSDLELWVAEHARDVIFLHAGCVAVDGWAIVLPGFTLSGKTTLTRALVDAGASYLSDEYAVLTADGSVLPYRRPLSVRVPDEPVVQRIELDRAQSRHRRGFRRDRSVRAPAANLDAGWDVAQLSRSHAILQLLQQTVAARSRPVDATLALERAATEQAMTVQGTRGEAAEAGRATDQRACRSSSGSDSLTTDTVMVTEHEEQFLSRHPTRAESTIVRPCGVCGRWPREGPGRLPFRRRQRCGVGTA